MTLTLASLLLVLATMSTAQAQERVELVRADGHTIANSDYRPSQNCLGIAIISHGAGGTENGYSYLAKALQMRQWLAIVPGHQESGLSALKEHMRSKGLRSGLASLITDRQAYLGRFMDLQAALSYAQQICAHKPQVLIGHSMGAATTMLAAGAHNRLQLDTPSFNFDAYIALSPQGVGSIFPEKAWRDIQRKVLVMTGTRDTELGGASWQTRLDSYADMPPGCKWRAVVDAATHMSFAGNNNSAQEQRLIINTIWQFIESDRATQCPLPPSESGTELKSK